ncbi:hypothetical protein [Dyadobacter psychrotolerans]|uniref:Uncharacterized protein n=1 Tax=Dyadobacter psychrotolerans TaxID=2541721 RepID=A0A4R5DFI0_9BACT|nr:hypothetical protein [Dyadobacter psychrotolerans]TDE12519.1 hypothetical protein E0F88_22785 [Dyadobacter psychrotolerans]
MAIVQKNSVWLSAMNVLDDSSLIDISGGEVVVSAKDASEIGKEAGANIKGMVDGWNDFWSNLQKSYNQHRQ